MSQGQRYKVKDDFCGRKELRMVWSLSFCIHKNLLNTLKENTKEKHKRSPLMKPSEEFGGETAKNSRQLKREPDGYFYTKKEAKPYFQK